MYHELVKKKAIKLNLNDNFFKSTYILRSRMFKIFDLFTKLLKQLQI